MSELLPRCSNVFGYCAKTKAPKGKRTTRVDKEADFPVLPDCELDWRTCPDYRILVVTFKKLPQSSSATPAEAPTL